MKTANTKQTKKKNIDCVKDTTGNCIVSKSCDRGVKKRCFDGKISGTQCSCKDDSNYNPSD